MLNPSFVVIGIGRAFNSNSTYGWYWTTDFGGFLDQTISPNPNPAPSSAPTISSFMATPSAITAGQVATLTWSVSGAATITVDGGVGDVSSITSRTVSPTQTTTYTLTASNSRGTATARVTVTVNAAADTQAPTTPTLSAAAKSATEVDLSWTASTDNVGVAGYQVTRNGSVLGTFSKTVLSYSDTSVSPQTNYVYTIKAFDAAGNYSMASNVAWATTPALPAPSACPGPSTNAFTGCYYNNVTLTGNPVLVRTDSQIGFNWFYSPPVPSVTTFSVRWQGNFTFDQGNYTFSVTTSDGMRVYIDGNLVLNGWRDQSPSMYTIHHYLSQGTHLITVEYFEETRSGTAQVTWKKN
jgi:hypothetical protein